MTEKTNKRRIRPLRTALIAAAAVAMMVVSVAAANPEMVEDFTMRIARPEGPQRPAAFVHRHPQNPVLYVLVGLKFFFALVQL